MDEEISRNEKSNSALLPVLGILGLGVGVVALALGVFCLSKIGDTTADINDKIEKAAALSLETKKISDRVDSLALQLESIKSTDNSKVSDLAKEVSAALGQIGNALNKHSEEISENRKGLEEIARRAAISKNVVKAQKAEDSASSAQDTAQADTSAEKSASGATRTHKIQSGDTFAKLAVKYKVSVDSIVKANPNLNPSRLKIGQEVVIP